MGRSGVVFDGEGAAILGARAASTSSLTVRMTDPLPPFLDDVQDWAAVITGQAIYGAVDQMAGVDLVNTAGGSNQKVLNGWTWISRVDPTAFDLAVNAGITIRNGPLIHYGGPDPCVNVAKSSLPGDVVFEPTLIFGPTCSSEQWFEKAAFQEPQINADLDNTTDLPLRDGPTRVGDPTIWGTIGADTVFGALAGLLYHGQRGLI